MGEEAEIIKLDPHCSGYPKDVELKFSSPPCLSAMGNLGLLEKPSIGFCGSRKVSPLGLEATYNMAKNAAENGLVVVSGNAKGVDSAAHFSGLENGGDTILVLPEGMDNFRIRSELREVWDWQRTLVISQFEPNARWQGWRAMQRNKLVVALSDAVIVVEAGEKGGTLDAGNVALKMGRTLFVADYETVPAEAVGNSVLLSKGGEKLAPHENFMTRIAPAQAAMPF